MGGRFDEDTTYFTYASLLFWRCILFRTTCTGSKMNNILIFFGGALFQLLETAIKNCGDIFHMHVAERDVLHEMVKIVKKKV